MDSLPAAEAAREIDTTPATLRRWVERGLIPQFDGAWTTSAVAHARLVARMRVRGHSLDEIRDAVESGRLAFGYLQELFPSVRATHTLADAAAETGLEENLIETIFTTMGLPASAVQQITDNDLELLRYGAAA